MAASVRVGQTVHYGKRTGTVIALLGKGPYARAIVRFKGWLTLNLAVSQL